MIPAPLIPPVSAVRQLTVQDAPLVRQVDNVLRVKFTTSEIDIETGQTVFGGGVEATYGPTVVRCDRLVIDSKASVGRATGKVVLNDPEGRLEATDLEFDWLRRTGSAEDVLVQAGTVRIEAKSIKVEPDTWTLSKATGSLARASKPPVSFEADSVTLKPGRSGVARRVFARVYGAKLGPVASVPFSLRKRVKGIGLPSITNRRGVGVGVNWSAQAPLSDYSALSAFWDAFPKRATGFGLEYAMSPLDPDSGTLISPTSDLGERVGDGWFNNVSVRDPSQESADLRARRLSYSIGTAWNQGTTARSADSENVSKAIELVAEMGGPFGDWGAKGVFRLHSIRSQSTEPFVPRGLSQFSLKPPDWIWNQDWRGTARADMFGSLSERSAFGWARAEAGLLFQPGRSWTLGAAFVAGEAAGRPDFEFDRLVSRRAVHLRADWQSGPYTARYLVKYDFDRKLWYDREYEFALVANVFEPFVLFREFPSDTRFGVRFRLDNLVDKLKERNQSR